MPITAEIKAIQEDIANNNLQLALDKMAALKELGNIIINFKRRYKKLREDRREDLIDYDTYNLHSRV